MVVKPAGDFIAPSTPLSSAEDITRVNTDSLTQHTLNKMDNNMEGKVTKPYAAPSLTVYGTVENITRGDSDGDFLDDTFPTNTPKPELTFST